MLILSHDIIFEGEPAPPGETTGFVAQGRGFMRIYTSPPFEKFLLKPTAERIYALEMRYELTRGAT